MGKYFKQLLRDLFASNMPVHPKWQKNKHICKPNPRPRPRLPTPDSS